MKEQLDRMLIKLQEIEAKLDKVIEAIREHDEVDEDFNDVYDDYGQRRTPPCVGHDVASWDEEVKEKKKPASTSKPKKKYYKPKKKKNETL